LDSDADDGANEDDNNDDDHQDSPPVLKLTSVTVDKERYLFGEGKGAIVSNKALNFGEKNTILLTVHSSDKFIHKKIAALIIAINNPLVQELFEAAGIITTAVSPQEQLKSPPA
jgi:hypothetical protein